MKLILLQIFFISNIFATGLPQSYYKITNTKQMKEYFFNFIKIRSNKENQLILQDREYIIKHFNNKDLKFKSIQKRYKLQDDDTLDKYLLRIDIVPISIILAQAAIESGWGKSRFVKQANNIFGHWTWKEKGLIPKDRDINKKHKIRIFNTIEQSIKAYLLNLNIGHAYIRFRTKRFYLRKHNSKLIGRALCSELRNYSQLRTKYTKLLSDMIRREKLERFD